MTFCGIAAVFALTPQSTHIQTVSNKSSHQPIVHIKPPEAKPKPVTPTPQPTPVATPQPVVSPAPTPVTHTSGSTAVRTSNTVEPVVTPSPSSSVSGLSPTSSSSGGSTSTSSGGSGTSTPTTTTTTSYTSTNWSGYLAANGNYTDISGSWQATSPTGNGTSTSADATWIGIGGVTSADLIQIGTDNTVSASGQVSTSAFYELLPNASITINSITVSPGDSLTANIDEVSSGVWNISLTDNTNNETFSLQVNYTSTNSSAEWIEEDPSYANGSLVPFDNFGTATFTNASTVSNGSTLNLTTGGAQPITLVDQSGQPVATPSAISSNGTGFTVTHS